MASYENLSISVEYNSKEIYQITIENILKMLKRRNLIDSVEDEYKKLEKDIGNKLIYSLILNNNTTCGIYFLNIKISTIVVNSPLDDYLSNNTEVNKIIIAKEVTKKVIKQITTEYKNTEFFFEYEMLEDLPNKVYIPEHKILNNAEKEELLSKFTESELSRIIVTDIMSRYYGAKIGDIFRICRPSFTSGKNIFYRKVVNGSLDILF
jgi:DNA-directed RNA polymerase I, II, and III subunit RPABC1|uniref:RNA polymerase subunit H/Rpb5 C-terminal domain-containing protein n=1 Tax=viral metagenome TaxID=1070528 RepID=A0A6C0EE09_9ZZZZ